MSATFLSDTLTDAIPAGTASHRTESNWPLVAATKLLRLSGSTDTIGDGLTKGVDIRRANLTTIN